MTDNEETTTPPEVIQMSTPFQLLDDLLLVCENENIIKEFLGRRDVGAFYTQARAEKGVSYYLIIVGRGLAGLHDTEPFLKAFVHEFSHYCIDKVILEWFDSKIFTPLYNFISEMLSEKRCWGCEYFGSINCWRYPDNPLHDVIKNCELIFGE